MECAISVSHLKVNYRDKKGKTVQAVQDLSFEVNPGEVVGFLGPNGAGKSSTIKALLGFQPIAGGSATIFGHEAGHESSRRRTGYLPEVAMYYPYLTPRETLRFYGELQGLKGASLRKEADELLEAVGMVHAADMLNRGLSKGMMQRVGIAQSLLGNPELLILDEVTSGLDPVGRQELRRLLKRRQEQGTTLFFSSHELAEVEMLCDRILIIHKGKLVEEREMGRLKSDLRKFQLEFVGHTSMVGLTEDMVQISPTQIRASFSTKEDLLAAVDRVQKGGAKVLDILSAEGSLEDYFVQTILEAA